VQASYSIAAFVAIWLLMLAFGWWGEKEFVWCSILHQKTSILAGADASKGHSYWTPISCRIGFLCYQGTNY